MKPPIFSFIRKNIPLLVIIVLVIGLFCAYNTFLIDHSLVNLKSALEQLANAKTTEDFEKIKPLLKIVLLNEISKKSVSDKNVISLELAENIVSSAKNLKQIEDVKYYLHSVLAEKEQQRGNILSVFDRINEAFVKPGVTPAQNELETQANRLLAKIDTVSDLRTRQELYTQLSVIYLKLERYPEVAITLSKLIEIDPKSNLATEAKFNLAWTYKKTNDYKKAVEIFEEVSKEFADKRMGIMSHYEIADTFIKQGIYEEARNKYVWLAAQYPDFDMADLALYEAGYISYYYLNDRATALRFFSQLEKKYPNANIVKYEMFKVRPVMAAEYRKQGYDSLKSSNYADAINKFQEATTIAPHDGRSWSGMGLGLYWMRKEDEAVEKVTTAVTRNFDDEPTIDNSLFVYVNATRYDEAIAIGEKALSKNRMTTSQFYYNLGCAYYFKKDYKKALNNFSKAASIKSRSAAITNNVGCALWATEHFNPAIKSFKEAISYNPRYANAYFNLGVSYLSINNLVDALQVFKKVLDIEPNNNEARLHVKQIEKMLTARP